MRQSFALWFLDIVCALIFNIGMSRYISGKVASFTVATLIWYCFHLLWRNILFRRCSETLRFGHDENAIVTGATVGIGAACAQEMQRKGANVVYAGRSTADATKAIGEVENMKVGTSGEAMHLDLSDMESVKRFCREYKQKYKRLNILVCNAGYHGPFRTTNDGYEYTIGVNHFGHVLLISLLWDLLISSSTPENPSRVIVVASDLHRFARSFRPEYVRGPIRDYTDWTVYSHSKFCNVLFGLKLGHLVRDSKAVRVHIVHPGTPVKTKLMRNNFLTKTPLLNVFLSFMYTLFCRDAWLGAQTLLTAALRPDDGESGHYFENCDITTPSEAAQDQKQQDLLWHVTCSELNLDTDWPCK